MLAVVIHSLQCWLLLYIPFNAGCCYTFSSMLAVVPLSLTLAVLTCVMSVGVGDGGESEAGGAALPGGRRLEGLSQHVPHQ